MHSKRILLAATIISVSAMLAACSSDDDDDNNGDDGAGDTSTPVDGDNTGDTGNSGGLSGLDGTWVQACLADDPDDAESEYSTGQSVFNGNMVTVTEMTYTDSGCTIAADPAVIVIESSFVFPGGTTTTALGDATHIDVTIESVTLDGEPLSDEFSDLIGLNDIEYDLVLIDNDMLYVGDTDGDLDGSTEALRPNALDTRLVMTRQ